MWVLWKRLVYVTSPWKFLGKFVPFRTFALLLNWCVCFAASGLIWFIPTRPNLAYWASLPRGLLGFRWSSTRCMDSIFRMKRPGQARQLFVMVEKIAAKCSDRILSQNPEDIQTAIRLGIAAKSSLFELGNGVELTRFRRDAVGLAVTESLRRELGLTSGPVVGFVGRCVREKGLVELLEAMVILRESLPDVQLICVGRIDNDRGDAIDPAYADKMGLRDAVKFLGLRQDIPELLSVMDVLALPSHREGFPRAPMEAAAMGLPSVVTDIRGCRQSVQHEQTGLLVPLQNPDALAAALMKILSDANYAAELGQRAAAYALEEFDEQRVFQRVVETYRQLCAAKGVSFPQVSV